LQSHLHQIAPIGQTVNAYPKQEMDLLAVDAFLEIEKLGVIKKADEEANEYY